MAKIFRPDEPTDVSRVGISPSIASQAGAGAAQIGAEVASTGKDFQHTNVGALARQVSDLVSAEGNRQFQESKRAHQTGMLANSMSKATLEFQEAQQQRISRLTDEHGNPTFTTLVDDIGNIGKGISDNISGKMLDPEVATRFKNDFSNYISNQQVLGLKKARNQQISFSRASLDTGLGTLLKQGGSDSPDNINLYEGQAIDLLNESLNAGFISPEEHASKRDDFLIAVREANLQNTITEDPAKAKGLLDNNTAEQLGVTTKSKAKLDKILDSKIRSDEIEAKKAKRALEKDAKDRQNLIAEDLEKRIEAGALREDELLQQEGNLSPKTFSKLKKKYIRDFRARNKEAIKMSAISEAITNEEDISQFTKKDITNHYSALVEAQGSLQGKPSSLQQKAAIAMSYKDTVVAPLAKELDSSLLSGTKNESLSDAVLAYTYLRDRKGETLESRELTKESVAIAEYAELLNERANMTLSEGVFKARESILEGKKDPIKQERSKEFNKLDDFKGEELFETAADNLPGAENLFFINKKVDDDTALLYKKLVQEEYVRTGDIAAAKEIAGKQMGKSHGVSTINGEEEVYMFAPPEKFFPVGTTSEDIRNVLETDLTGAALPEGVNVDQVEVYSDFNTRGLFRTRINPETGEPEIREVISYGLEATYTTPEGTVVKLPLIDQETGELQRWEVDAKGVEPLLEERKQATIEEARLEMERRRGLESVRAGLGQDVKSGTIGGSFAIDTGDIGRPQEEEVTVPSLEKESTVKTSDVTSRVNTYVDTVAPRANPTIKSALSQNSSVLEKHGIDNPSRLKAFIAQMAHESANFKALVERRSDASAEKKYGVGTRVGKILGNTETGDGAKYKGRGIIQLTGRDNYDRLGKLIGKDLINNPELAADPDTAVEIAAIFWKEKGLNELADQGKFKEITRRINGGFNGLQDRTNKLNKLKDLD
jgi:predicted chitinase